MAEDPGSFTSNGFQFMDRNLGALVNEPGDMRSLGLYYQWGRKDPFPGPADMATITPSDQEFWFGDGSEGRIDVSTEISFAASILNPLGFMHNSSAGGTWLGSVVDSTWGNQAAKTVLDPYPVGWRVPPTYTAYADFTDTTFPKHSIYAGRMHSGSWFPSGGSRSTSSYGDVRCYMLAVGNIGSYWTSLAAFGSTYELYFHANATSNGIAQDNRLTGLRPFRKACQRYLNLRKTAMV